MQAGSPQQAWDQQQTCIQQPVWIQQLDWAPQPACIQQPVWNHQSIQHQHPHQQPAASDQQALQAEKAWLEWQQQQAALEWHDTKDIRHARVMQWVQAEQWLWGPERCIQDQIQEEIQTQQWVQEQERAQEQQAEIHRQVAWPGTQQAIAVKLFKQEKATLGGQLETVRARLMDEVPNLGMQELLGGPAPDGQWEAITTRISRSLDMGHGMDIEACEDERSCAWQSFRRRLTI